jgi:hypothetical protein
MLPDTGGFVLEYDSNGMASARSQFAIEKVIGEDADTFKTYVLNDISRLAPSAPAVFARSSAESESSVAFTARAISTALGFARTQPYSFLVPFGRTPDGGVAYYVHMFDPDSAQTRQVLREDAGNEGAPLIVSTSDPDFTSTISKTDYIGRAKNRRELLDRFGSDTGVYLGVD